MKDGLRNDPAPPQPCRPQGSHSHAQGWLEAACWGSGKSGGAGQDAVGLPHSRQPWRTMVLPGCSSGTAHVPASSPHSGNAMVSPAPPQPPQRQPRRLIATYIMAK